MSSDDYGRDGEGSGLEIMTRCLHQVFPGRKGSFPPPPEGAGDCGECKYDPENNKKCSMYVPVRIRAYYVKP